MLRHEETWVLCWVFLQELDSTNITKIQNALFLLNASAAESSGCYVTIGYIQSCVAL